MKDVVRISSSWGDAVPQKPKPLDDTASVRAWWGVELRNWRNTRCLSSVTLGKKVHLSGTAIERIEKNERPCNAALAGRLDDVLEAGGALRRLWVRVEQDADKHHADADNSAPASSVVGMLEEEPSARLDRSPSPVERRAFLAVGGTAALVPGSFTDLIPKLGHTPPPEVVRAGDIEQVWAASTALAGWGNLYGGGGIVRETCIGQLIWAKDLLNAKCPPALKGELFAAVGRLAIVMGASAFDAYEHQDATRLLAFGSVCAESADNWHLRASALNWRARHAIWCGFPNAGLTHAENGLVRADRLTPREQAMLHNARARALAKMAKPQETLAAIGRSDEIFSRAGDDEDPTWMSFYDHAQHHGDTGHALFDIALIPGQSPRTATERLTTATNTHTDPYVRSRALSGTKLATLIMATDPYEAVSTAHRALDMIGRLRSGRAIDDVLALVKASTHHRRIPAVAELRERMASTVRT